ncbi:MAG: hypothetical protein ABIR36_17245 [Nitrospiraceae bacterium]
MIHSVRETPLPAQALSRLRKKKAALEILMRPTFNPRRSLALDRAVLALERREGQP